MNENKQAEPVAQCGHESCDCRGYCQKLQTHPTPAVAQGESRFPFAGFDPNFCPGSNPENPQEAPAVAQSWELNEETAKFLADLILANDEPTPVTLSVGFIKDDDGKIQHGLRVHESEYPEEGAELLVESTPSPQKAPPADVLDEPLTDERKLEIIKNSELWDMHIHMGWYSVPSKSFAEKAFKLIDDIQAALKSAKEHGL